VTEDEE
jgi:hypothetical protein